MRISVNEVRKLPRVMTWIKTKTQLDDPPLFSSTGGKDLANLLHSKPHVSPLVVLVPSRTDTKWWQDLIGANNENVYFLAGRPAKSSIGLAVVIFRLKTRTVDLRNYREWDTPVLTKKLNELGLTDRMIATKIGAPSQMTIVRAKKDNTVFFNRMKLINQLLTLYQRLL